MYVCMYVGYQKKNFEETTLIKESDAVCSVYFSSIENREFRVGFSFLNIQQKVIKYSEQF